MFRRNVLGVIVACAALAAGTAGIHATSGHGRTLVVTMTNDPNANQLKVYDAQSHVLLQTLSTHGKGGVGGNARGIKQHDSQLVAVVNNGSNSVALFRRDGDALKFDKVLSTTSAPVSVDFGNDHLYVAGATTVDSFVLHQNSVQWLDGTTTLALAGGGAPPAGSTGQVGVIGERQLLVTLKTDPDPGTVDRSISRVVGTGNNVFVDGMVAAQIPTGAPADIDADSGILGVIDHGAGQSHLSLFTYNRFGELSATGSTITVGVPDANGVAFLSPRDDDRN